MIAPRPFTLVAELTSRCPLRCGYCSNPVWYGREVGLDTATWLRVLAEAEALGVVQVNFTGGEPLLREDLEQFVARARDLTLYTNLITSGIPLERARLARLRQSGLDALQLSIQAAARSKSDELAGASAFDRKVAVARWAKELDIPLTINIVLHRENLDDVEEMIGLAEDLGADRLELANTQYLGWALVNRDSLLPARSQLERARAIAQAARVRLEGRMEVVFVLPDYYADLPRSCMDGWGRRYIIISPEGLVLPCHAAHTLAALHFENIKDRSLDWIWNSSEGFNQFRGEAWMPSPCRSCERRSLDFGGCRCQAYHLTGQAAATDPACRYAPQHGIVLEARLQADAGERRALQPRTLPVLP